MLLLGAVVAQLPTKVQLTMSTISLFMFETAKPNFTLHSISFL